MKTFTLSKENLELAKSEVLTLTKAKKYTMHYNLISIETKLPFSFLRRLAYTKKVNNKELKQGFGKRRPHLRPGFHPSSLNPKLARAFVNLTGIRKGSIVDMFCGTGGILIEAGLIGLNIIGYDIDKQMLNRAELNFKHFKIKNYKLYQKDATKIKRKFNYIVADLPYGHATKKIDKNLYLNFLKNLKKILKKRAVIGFPDFAPYKKLIKAAKLKIKGEFTIYLHKRLSKKIVILE
jgi:tRNA (guanine10-N2)-dimethyltransferase